MANRMTIPTKISGLELQITEFPNIFYEVRNKADV